MHPPPGRGDIPIGVYKGTALAEVASPYARAVAERCPNDLGPAERVPDVLKVYRRALSSQPDGAVTMIAVGQMNNLVDLLASPAEQPVLLLVDNCEHVVDAAASAIGAPEDPYQSTPAFVGCAAFSITGPGTSSRAVMTARSDTKREAKS